ncbi:MAG: PKD domain-containing protein [Flavobacteriales bacterium]
MRLISICLLLCFTWPKASTAQCNDCTPAPDCTSADGFPTICPEQLPAGETDVLYEEVITFFLPAEVTDPSSGAVADLQSVTITGIQGVPQGLTVVLDDPDGVYAPASGQTSGCASICGTPIWPGDFVITISISAIASVFGFEQTVTDSFTYDLQINPGPGGTSTFTASQTSGCDSISVDFAATATGTTQQSTSYAWDFGNGSTSEADSVTAFFGAPGDYNVVLTTTIEEPVLVSISINSSGGGGWDDFFTPPDLYFVLTDGSGNAVYNSSVVTDNNNPSWLGLSIPVNNPPYTIQFWDEDVINSDDNMGNGTLITNVTGINSFAANPTFGVSDIEWNPVITLTDTMLISVAGPPTLPNPWVADEGWMYAPVDSMLQFTWLTGDSALANGPDSTFIPESNGWYHYQAISTFGCTGTSDSTLFCGLTPAVNLSLDINEFTNEPLALSCNLDLNEYLWWNADSAEPTDTTDTPMLFPATSGWYQAAGWDVYGCAATPESLLVCWPLPVLEIAQVANGDLITWEGLDFYTWYQDGEPMMVNDWVLPSPGTGFYVVEGTDHPDCPVTASEGWTYVGLSPNMNSVSFKVYPNPFADQIHITPPPEHHRWSAELWTSSGSILAKSGCRQGMDSWAPHLPNTASGHFILIIRNEPHGDILVTQPLIRTP